jgi:SAM-dependent methyltransferase
VTNVPPSRPVEAGALDDAHKRLAATFDRAGELYQRARPEYPDELYDRLLQITQLSPGARLLEDWTPAGEAFAMVFAATAWHWVDPTVRYRKAADALAPGGYLALWGAGHVIPRDGDPFFEELQEVYDEIGESLPPGTALPRPQELADDRAEIEASGLFDVTDITQYDWETVYDAEGYIDLLNTFSGHIAMQDWQRDRLYSEIRRRLAMRINGRLRRHWGSVLHIARHRTV